MHLLTTAPPSNIYFLSLCMCSDRAWCYTTDPDSRWEYCNVPHCPGDKYREIC